MVALYHIIFSRILGRYNRNYNLAITCADKRAYIGLISASYNKSCTLGWGEKEPALEANFIFCSEDLQ